MCAEEDGGYIVQRKNEYELAGRRRRGNHIDGSWMLLRRTVEDAGIG